MKTLIFRGIVEVLRRLVFLSERVFGYVLLLMSVFALAPVYAEVKANGDGTVTDSSTALTWKQCMVGYDYSLGKCQSNGKPSSYTWGAASGEFEAGWRLPTREEIEGIVDRSKFNPTIDTALFPFQMVYSSWTSTQSDVDLSLAYYVNLVFGNTGLINKDTKLGVRLVKGGAGSTTTTSTTTTTTTTTTSSQGGTTTTSTTTTTTIPSISYTMNVGKGWNLLGNSLTEAIDVTKDFSSSSEFNSIWKWDVVKGKWQFYSPAMSAVDLAKYAVDRGYDVLSTIGAGEGFWVNALVQKNIPRSGSRFDLKLVNLKNGWNLVATAEDVLPSLFNQNLSLNPPDPSTLKLSNFSTLWAWNNSASNWFFYAPSLDLSGSTDLSDYIAAKKYLDFASYSKTLGKGVGFWVNVSSENLDTSKSLSAVAFKLSGNTITAVAQAADGTPLPNAVVTFSTDSALAQITPASGSVLTDSKGEASIVWSPASLTVNGATMMKAVAKLGSKTVENSIGFSVGTTPVVLSEPIFLDPLDKTKKLTSINAFNSAIVEVNVTVDGKPVSPDQLVTFASPCMSSNKAILTTSTLTVLGVARASYRDNGCGGKDLITASVGGGKPTSATIEVAPPAVGSLQYVSATPNMITLKGMGGAGMQESAQVVFKVVDSAGNPLGGQAVKFELSTDIGGISLTAKSGVSDSVTGLVAVGVLSGTISTPVRVLATVSSGATLTTQSDELRISTGIPDQNSFSLSAGTYNIEGLNYDGTETVLTARLADHFNNPVPDKTAVNFIAEGGAVDSSCLTVKGACSVTLRSQNPRPLDGRVTVLAYAVGEESFTDTNGNGLADKTELFTEDSNGVKTSTDLPAAFLDVNEDSVRNSSEMYLDFNGPDANGVRSDAADGFYNGVICDHSVAPNSTNTACSARKSVHVRQSAVLIFSGSYAVISIVTPNDENPLAFENPCSSPPKNVVIGVVDSNGNIMPAGTTIDFKATNGKVNTDKITIPNTNTKVPSPYVISVQPDGAIDKDTGQCLNSVKVGTLSVIVTTPNKNVTSASITVTD